MDWSCVGHERQKELIERLIATGRLAHAYLLTGPGGVGKRMFADDVVRALIATGYEPDAMVLTPDRDKDGVVHDIPIEAVRDMKHWVVFRPAGTYKTVVIDDADRLGAEAANTLLKVLEEPPTYAKFLLITDRPGAVMPTISSRCERMDFMPLEADRMKPILARLKLDADDRELLAVVAAGRPGYAVNLVEAGKLPKVARHIASLEATLKGGVTERLLYAKKVADDEDAPDIAQWWLTWVHAHLAQRPALAPVARGLAQLISILREPQFNRRLALEAFLLDI
ncbi:MAG TPA: AAA family ATPase [Candidatus Paceibacterota bacterium]|nr:AAA family ATPase [Candidatus Paceibacterota bacterium]